MHFKHFKVIWICFWKQNDAFILTFVHDVRTHLNIYFFGVSVFVQAKRSRPVANKTPLTTFPDQVYFRLQVWNWGTFWQRKDNYWKTMIFTRFGKSSDKRGNISFRRCLSSKRYENVEKHFHKKENIDTGNIAMFSWQCYCCDYLPASIFCPTYKI